MATINIDELESAKPVSVVIDGTEYSTVPLTLDLMKRVASAPEAVDKHGYTQMHRQLGILLGLPVSTFKMTDLRKIKQAVLQIDKAFNAGLEAIAENPFAASEEQK